MDIKDQSLFHTPSTPLPRGVRAKMMCQPSAAMHVWGKAVGLGSAVAVGLARRL